MSGPLGTAEGKTFTEEVARAARGGEKLPPVVPTSSGSSVSTVAVTKARNPSSFNDLY